MAKVKVKDDALKALSMVASKQFGMVTLADALAQNLSRRQVRRLLDIGALVRAGCKVYRFPAVPDQSWEFLAMKATLLAGPGSALSHQTAGFLHGLDGLESFDAPTVLDVMTVENRNQTVPGHRVHRSRAQKLHATTLRGLPVTSLPKTVLDLADVLPRLELEKTVDSARRKHRNFEAWFKQFVGSLANHGRHHVNDVLRMIARHAPLDSAFEVEMRALIAAEGLPEPIWGYTVYENNKRIMKVDAAWLTPRKVAAHFDGFGTHGLRAQFEKDAIQRTKLAEFDWANVIITWRGRHELYWRLALRKFLLVNNCT